MFCIAHDANYNYNLNNKNNFIYNFNSSISPRADLWITPILGISLWTTSVLRIDLWRTFSCQPSRSLLRLLCEPNYFEFFADFP